MKTTRASLNGIGIVWASPVIQALALAWLFSVGLGTAAFADDAAGFTPSARMQAQASNLTHASDWTRAQSDPALAAEISLQDAQYCIAENWQACRAELRTR